MKNLSKQSMSLIERTVSAKEILRIMDANYCSDYSKSLALILIYGVKNRSNLNLDQFKDLQEKDKNFLTKVINHYDKPFEKDFFKLIYNKHVYMETISLFYLLKLSDRAWSTNELMLFEEFSIRKIQNQTFRDKMLNKLALDYKSLNAATDKCFDSMFDDLVNYLFKINYEKFTYKYINQTLFISSLYDKWYCEFNFHNEQIVLYHANKRHDVNKYHIQKTFKSHFATIENVLGYIDHHDSYVMNERYNYDYVSKILNKKRKTMFT